jgi:hypothetical protein
MSPPTSSQLIKKSDEPETMNAEDVHFVQSMRDHRANPANQFRQSVEQRMATWGMT